MFTHGGVKPFKGETKTMHIETFKSYSLKYAIVQRPGNVCIIIFEQFTDNDKSVGTVWTAN